MGRDVLSVCLNLRGKDIVVATSHLESLTESAPNPFDSYVLCLSRVLCLPLLEDGPVLSKRTQHVSHSAAIVFTSMLLPQTPLTTPLRSQVQGGSCEGRTARSAERAAGACSEAAPRVREALGGSDEQGSADYLRWRHELERQGAVRRVTCHGQVQR
eukprot:3707235-Rhodomonas_salina.2